MDSRKLVRQRIMEAAYGIVEKHHESLSERAHQNVRAELLKTLGVRLRVRKNSTSLKHEYYGGGTYMNIMKWCMNDNVGQTRSSKVSQC
jgi:hypothetical protein